LQLFNKEKSLAGLLGRRSCCEATALLGLVKKQRLFGLQWTMFDFIGFIAPLLGILKK
jgi:hypothetical protein